ncbi:MAG TPA: mechanosensitive ion channel family protein [Steroidobacteraceae bacterium]|nr:mechanosensitive ion channel family protein [Steroidobacteraceae bacterium]
MQWITETLTSWFGAGWATPLMSLVRVIVIVLLAIVAKVAAGRLIRLLRKRIAADVKDAAQVRRLETVSRALRYVASTVIVLIAGLLVLSELGVSIAPILGAAGIVGLAVGFGAQSLVKDYFAGFFLLLENQLARGDVVRIADLDGLVEDVTLRYVRLRDYSGNVHYVPNGLITTVTNMTRDFSYALMDIGVAYREDLDEVFAAIRETAGALQRDPSFAGRILEPLDIAGVENLADSAVVVRCRFKVRPLEQWNVRREFLRRIKSAFDARGIEIPYPHLTLYAGADQKGSAPAFRLRQE